MKLSRVSEVGPDLDEFGASLSQQPKSLAIVTFYRSFFFFDLDSSEVRLRRLFEKNTVLYETVRLGSVPIDGVAYRIPPASSYLEFDNTRTQGLILITLGDRPHSPDVYRER